MHLYNINALLYCNMVMALLLVSFHHGETQMRGVQAVVGSKSGDDDSVMNHFADKAMKRFQPGPRSADEVRQYLVKAEMVEHQHLFVKDVDVFDETEMKKERMLQQSARTLHGNDVFIWQQLYDATAGDKWTCPVSRDSPCFTLDTFEKQSFNCKSLGVYVLCDTIADNTYRIVEISLQGNNLNGIFNPDWISTSLPNNLPALNILSIRSMDNSNKNFLRLPTGYPTTLGSNCATLPRCNLGTLACLFQDCGINLCPILTNKPTRKTTSMPSTPIPTTPSSSISMTTSAEDRNLWKGLYYSLAGEKWKDCNSATSRDDPCNYCSKRVKCVSVSNALRIQEIDLSNNNLFGWIPEETLSSMQYLQVANFSSNSLTNQECIYIPRCFVASNSGYPKIICDFSKCGPKISLCSVPTNKPTASPTLGTTIVEESNAPTMSPTIFISRILAPDDLIAWNSFFDALGGGSISTLDGWVACGSPRFRNDPCTPSVTDSCGRFPERSISCVFDGKYWRITEISLRNNNIKDRWFPTTAVNGLASLKKLDVGNPTSTGLTSNRFTNTRCLPITLCLSGTCNFDLTGVSSCTNSPTNQITSKPSITPSPSQSPTNGVKTNSPTVPITTIPVHPQDLAAWQKIYNALGGPSWSNCGSNDNYLYPCAAKCSSPGQLVICENINGNMRITIVILQSNNLRGWIPEDALNSLTQLTYLDLSNSYSSPNPANAYLNTRCLNVPKCASTIECMFQFTSVEVCKTSTSPATASPTEREITKSPTSSISTRNPSSNPSTSSPTKNPLTRSPSALPTKNPSSPSPTNAPSKLETKQPTKSPSQGSTKSPSTSPTTALPTNGPTSSSPSISPTTLSPSSRSPSRNPTSNPTMAPITSSPTSTRTPTRNPLPATSSPSTLHPSSSTSKPTSSPLPVSQADLAAWKEIFDSLGGNSGKWIDCGTSQARENPCIACQASSAKIPGNGVTCGVLSPSSINEDESDDANRRMLQTSNIRIQKIVLRQNGLSGTLPINSFDNLTALKELDFSNISPKSNHSNEFQLSNPNECIALLPCINGLANCAASNTTVNFCTVSPTSVPVTDSPTRSIVPSVTPTANPTNKPSTKNPTSDPTRNPTTSSPTTTATPTKSPSLRLFTSSPTTNPTRTPTSSSPTTTTSPTTNSTLPTFSPTGRPSTRIPTRSPSRPPTRAPITQVLTSSPSRNPTTNFTLPTLSPTSRPSTLAPVSILTQRPTVAPTRAPTTAALTSSPTRNPTTNSTSVTFSPTGRPSTRVPTRAPTMQVFTASPTRNPTTQAPVSLPTQRPTTTSLTSSPTRDPTNNSTLSLSPTARPSTGTPTTNITSTASPTIRPSTRTPTSNPTNAPTTRTPTRNPTAAPITSSPTTARPSTVSPTAATPTTSSPTTARPSTVSPTVVTTRTPTTLSPTTVRPSTLSPSGTVTPTTRSPTSRRTNSPTKFPSSPYETYEGGYEATTGVPTNAPTRPPTLGVSRSPTTLSPTLNVSPIPSTLSPSGTIKPTTRSPTSRGTNSPTKFPSSPYETYEGGGYEGATQTPTTRPTRKN